MSTSLFLCIAVLEFPTQTLLRARPALRTTPVVVLEGTAPLEAVASANRTARQLGVTRGMRKSELSSFPALTVMQRSTIEESTTRAAVLDVAATFAPRMEEAASWADHSSFLLVLDITGCQRLFGSVERLARKLLHEFRSVNIEAHCAVSSNFPAAVCLARSATRRITVVPPDKTASALAPLPLSALPLTSDEAEMFSLWGLRNLGELASLPSLDLVARLGKAGERLHQLARGVAPHLMVPHESSLSLEEAMEFDTPVDTIDSLLFVLGPILDALIVRARAHAFELNSVTAHMSIEGGTTHTRTLKPALPVADRRLLLKLFQLDMAANPPSAGVLLLRVTAEPGVRSKVQTGLFTPQTPEPMRLEMTLARLVAMVGERNVGRPQLCNSHAPESFVVERFTIPEPATFNKTKTIRNAHTSKCALPDHGGSPATPGSSLPCCRNGVALRRLRPPIPISPGGEGGVLLAFFFQGTRYEVRERFGPWRRSGQWWSGEIWSREEWDISAEDTSSRSGVEPAKDGRLLCLVSHDLLHDRWQMDAVYD